MKTLKLRMKAISSVTFVAFVMVGCGSEGVDAGGEGSGGTDFGGPTGGARASGGGSSTGGSGVGGRLEGDGGSSPATGGADAAGGADAVGGTESTSGGTNSEGSGGAADGGGQGAGGSEMTGSGGSGPVGGVEDPTMRGFAAVAKYGVPTTTGGSAGRTVTVSQFAELKQHAESSEVVTILVSGTISASTAHELIKVQSNKTIQGVGSSGKLNKITLSVNGWSKPNETCEADDYGTFTPASNVIIRNLEFMGLADFPDDSDVDPDAIRVECYSHHVWIDHNTFQYGADGATDVKRGGDMVTISYNHYVKTEKTALIGHSDNNGAQDTGFLNVTFHHNFFDQTATRTPRVRFGYVHAYNNYYNITEHVFRIGPGGRIYAEANNVVSTAGKILRDTENEGSLTWTNTNTWNKGAYGEVGTQLLDADQSVSRPSYNDPVGPAPTSPPAAGVGRL